MEDILFKTFSDIAKQFDISRMINIGITLVVAIIIYIALVIVRKKLINSLDLGDDLKKRHAYATVFRIAKVMVAVITLIVTLQILGVNMSAFVVLFGVLGILFALALKDSLQDLFSGFTILMDKYFTVGDAVRYNGRDGIVVSFTIRTTKIEFLDDRSVMSVANRNISEISKLTHLVDIDLPLPYDEDRERVFEVLEGICEDIRQLDGIERCELKGTQEFGESAIIYKIRFFCEPNDRPDIKRAVNRTIQDGLKTAGMHIPYNQLDIHQID